MLFPDSWEDFIGLMRGYGTAFSLSTYLTRHDLVHVTNGLLFCCCIKRSEGRMFQHSTQISAFLCSGILPHDQCGLPYNQISPQNSHSNISSLATDQMSMHDMISGWSGPWCTLTEAFASLKNFVSSGCQGYICYKHPSPVSRRLPKWWPPRRLSWRRLMHSMRK